MSAHQQPTHELINPSDKILFVATKPEHEKALRYIVPLMYSGGYAVKRIADGANTVPLMLFWKGAEFEAWLTEHGIDNDWAMAHLIDIAEVCESAHYATAQTSTRSIVDQFHANANRLRAQHERINAEQGEARHV